MKIKLLYIVLSLFFIQSVYSQTSPQDYLNVDLNNSDSVFSSIRDITTDEIKSTNVDSEKRNLLDPDEIIQEHIPTAFIIDVSKDLKQIPFSSEVNLMGGLSISIPIEAYITSKGSTPQITLNYNSNSGQGIAGQGWNIGGISAISRTNKSFYFDNKTESVSLDATSAFVLDGVRLIKLNETASQIEYQTEQGNIKVVGYKNNNNISYFKASYPNGNTAIYGFSPNGDNLLFTYPVTQITDMQGNVTKMFYDKLSNNYLIKEIRYGNLAEASIIFNYEDRKGSLMPLYQSGLDLTLTKRLKSIGTSFNNSVFKTYNLNYFLNSDDLYTDLLDNVSCATEGKESIPLKFYYGDGKSKKEFVSVEKTALEYFTNSHLVRFLKGKIDLERDQDLIIAFPNKLNYLEWHRTAPPLSNRHSAERIESQYTTDHVLLSYDYDYGMMTFFKKSLDEYFVDAFFMDVDNAFGEELVTVRNQIENGKDSVSFDVYTYIRHTKEMQKKYTRKFYFGESLHKDQRDFSTANPKYFFQGDFNGDGKIDLLAISVYNALGKGRKSEAFLIDLEENQIRYLGETPFNYDVKFPKVKDNKTILDGKEAYDQSNKLFTFDYDGDGKTDLCLINDEGTFIYSFAIDQNNKYSIKKISESSIIKNEDLKGKSIYAADINGDGKTDLLVSPLDVVSQSNYNWTLYTSKGDATFSKKELRLAQGGWTSPYFLQDIDGDGQLDLIERREYNKKLERCEINIHFIKNEQANGSITINVPTGTSVIPTNPNSRNYFSQLIAIKDADIVFRKYQDNRTENNSLTGIVDGLGKTTKFKYIAMNGEDGYGYTKTTSPESEFPFYKFSGANLIVNRVQSYYNNSIIEDFGYTYTDAIFHKQGLGFLGFEVTNNINLITNLNVGRRFDPYNSSTLKSESLVDNDHQYINNKDYDYHIIIKSNKLKTVSLQTSVDKDYLNNTTVTSRFGYDTYGNLTDSKTDYGDGVIETASSKLKNIDNGKTYLLGLLEEQSETKTRNKESVTTKSVITYYDNYLPETKTSYYNDNKVSEQKFVYDDALNLKESKQRAYKSTNWLTTSYEYDDYGRIEKETDPLGLYDINKFNNKGLLESVTNHKGNTTQYKYDNWGRNSETIYADGVTESTEYKWSIDKPEGAVYAVVKKSSVDPETTTYYDYLGREIRSGQKRFDGSYLYTDQVYDKKGQVSKVSLPFKGAEASLWNTYQYDEYNRPTAVSYASGKKDSISYAPLKTTSVINGIKTTKTADASGAIVEIEDPAGTISYDLRADGQPKTVTAPGDVETSFEYDEYGRQTAITDPSAGRKQFVYDDQGNTYQEIDARGKVTQMLYDKYNRLKTKEVVGEQTSSYDYNADGLLETITNTNGSSKSFEYDALLRPKANKESIMDGKWLQKDYLYENGNLKSVAYTSQSGYLTSENYAYNNGHLSEIKIDGDRSIWKLTAENSLGMPTASTTGRYNRSYGYTQFGIPTSRIIKNGDKTVQDFGYEFNPATGNLIGRKDNTRPNLKQEGFGYDELNRLTRFGDKTMGYDIKGNITHKKSVGVFDYSSNKPYAIDLISTGEGEDQVLERNQDITYNAMMRPSSISEGGKTTNFYYDADASRIKMQTKQGDVEELTRYYIGSQYEYDSTPEGTEERLFLDGDAYEAPAVFVKKNQKEYLYYLGRDYLGSITHVLDADGNLLQELSYDAWGRLRKPENHELYAQGSEINPILGGRGYTGHEHLTHYGLINMNARLYDPVVGRFLSPDPYIQAPDFSQNYNRYSYVLNNPLLYKDLTGEWFGIDDLLVAGAGFIAGYVTHGISTGNWGASALASGITGAGMAWLGYNTAGLATGAITNATWNQAAGIGINAIAGQFMPSYGISIGNFGIGISPTIGLGSGGLTLGGGLGVGYSDGNFSISGGVGIGTNGLQAKSGYTGWNANAMYKGYGLGYGRTSYSASEVYGHSFGAQVVGTATAYFNYNSFAFSNDALGDKNDRWRTNAVELTLGRYSIGTNLYTNWGKNASGGEEGVSDISAPLIGKNAKKAWNNGQAYSAPLWIGYRNNNQITRIGFSHPMVQNLTQNAIHKYATPTPYFLNYDNFKTGGYVYSGSYNPFSLW